jgi:hypothetical protein
MIIPTYWAVYPPNILSIDQHLSTRSPYSRNSRRLKFETPKHHGEIHMFHSRSKMIHQQGPQGPQGHIPPPWKLHAERLQSSWYSARHSSSEKLKPMSRARPMSSRCCKKPSRSRSNILTRAAEMIYLYTRMRMSIYIIYSIYVYIYIILIFICYILYIIYCIYYIIYHISYIIYHISYII